MRLLFTFLKSNPLMILLAAFPIAVVANYADWNPIIVFIFSALGLVPFAGLIGKGTEELAAHTGPKVGGLLNATLGNSAELIITLVAIQKKLLELVKASITGAILGNLLFVMGFSMFLGGLKHGVQKFDRRQSSNNSALLALAVVALVIPSLFSSFIGGEKDVKVEVLSLGVAGLMMLLYVLGIIYMLKENNSPVTYQNPQEATWSTKKSIIVLALATGGVIWLSEILVGKVEIVTTSLGISEFFLGIILIPIVGNISEHLVAVQVALKNKMDLSVEVAVSSSLQIALLVMPILVFVSLLMGNPLHIIFNRFELLALGGGVAITALVSLDGESNWLEGAALMCVYLILGLAFFMLPSG
jgi:Ca2+:H+ antiporter